MIIVGSLLVLACYVYLMFLSPWILGILRILVFVAVVAMLSIIVWIGYTMATNPTPLPMEDFDEEPSEEEREELEIDD